MSIVVLILAFISFTLSASAGLGGSLVLVPAMAMMLGPKQGIAMAAALLAMNNVGKVIAYRRNVPLRATSFIVVTTVLGALAGSILMVSAPDHWVGAGVVAAIVLSFALERFGPERVRSRAAAPFAFFAGATSGFSGTSGPLKGIAIRSLSFDRKHFVGAASVVSLAGDTSKLAVFLAFSMYQRDSVVLAITAIPLMFAGVIVGRRINNAIGERGYVALFWAVMIGYCLRILCFS